MKKIFTIIIFSLFSQLLLAQELQSPESKLGYSLGDKFTFHHQVVDYFKYLAESSDQIILKKIWRNL